MGARDLPRPRPPGERVGGAPPVGSGGSSRGAHRPADHEAEPTHEDCRPTRSGPASTCSAAGAPRHSPGSTASAALPIAVLSNRIESAEHLASADLWCGRRATALDRLVAVLRDSVATAASAEIGRRLALAARAAADVADASAPRTPPAGRCATSCTDCSNRLRSTRSHARAASRRGRHTGRRGPPRRRAWWVGPPWSCGPRPPATGIGSAGPHDAAYCRWRGAQVALATGQGTVAARLLRRAARDAREHVPLSTAIAETRTARQRGAELRTCGQAASARSCRATATAAARPARLAPIVLADGP